MSDADNNSTSTMSPLEYAIPNNVLRQNKVVSKGRNHVEVGSNDFICNRSVDIGVLEPNFFIVKHFVIIYDSEPNSGNKNTDNVFVNLSEVESTRDRYFQYGILSMVAIFTIKNSNYSHPKFQ